MRISRGSGLVLLRDPIDLQLSRGDGSGPPVPIWIRPWVRLVNKQHSVLLINSFLEFHRKVSNMSLKQSKKTRTRITERLFLFIPLVLTIFLMQ